MSQTLLRICAKRRYYWKANHTMPIMAVSPYLAYLALDIAERDVCLLSQMGYVRRLDHGDGTTEYFDGEELLGVIPTFQNALFANLANEGIDPDRYTAHSPLNATIDTCRTNAAVTAGTSQPIPTRRWLAACFAFAWSRPEIVIGTRPLTASEQAEFRAKPFDVPHVELGWYTDSYSHVG